MTDREKIKRWLTLEGATMQLYQQIPKLRTKKERAEMAEAAYSLADVLMYYHGYISKNMTRDEIVKCVHDISVEILKDWFNDGGEK